MPACFCSRVKTEFTTRRLLYDGHGSTRQLVSGTSAISVNEQYNYDAYGVGLGLPDSPGTSLLYAGELYDSVLKQYYLRARYYDPSNGRFNQIDSFKGNNDDPQSLHKYEYAHNDPVNNSDPLGQWTIGELVLDICIYAWGVAMAHPILATALVLAAGVAFPEMQDAFPPGSPGPFDEIADFGAAIRGLVNNGYVKKTTTTVIRGIPRGAYRAYQGGKEAFLKTLREGARRQGRWTKAWSNAMYGSESIQAAEAEFVHYATIQGRDSAMVLRHTSVAEITVSGNMLDLTDPNVYNKLGITWAEMTDNATGGGSTKLRELTEQLWENGVQIIKVPSARLEGAASFVVIDDVIGDAEAMVKVIRE
jgi:RHS repeat-associated protein